MRSINKKVKSRSSAVAVAACIAFLLSALFSFGFFNISKKSVSADGSYGNDVGVRFVQVAAGEDFAIGLTYDGDLYAWSLLASGNGQKPDAKNTDTLGKYYTSTPSKIGPARTEEEASANGWFSFRAGPGTNNEAVKWNNGQGEYHKASYIDERIVSIATTRYTAAFITDKGYIYTWGKDAEHYDITYIEDTQTPNNLLLRATSNNVGNFSWFQPYIIDYEYYKNAAIRSLRPVSGAAITNMSIAGGEYNYIVSYNKSNSAWTYVWGSLMYGVTNVEKGYTEIDGASKSGYDFSDEIKSSNTTSVLNDQSQRYLYRLNTDSVTNMTAPTAVAGGYQVGVNWSSASSGATSLSLRGKNFVTTQNATENSGKYTLVNTVTTLGGGDGAYTGVSNISYKGKDGVEYTNAILGSSSSVAVGDEDYILGASNDKPVDAYYGRQKNIAEGSQLVYTLSNLSDANKLSDVIFDSRGNELTSDKDKTSQIVRYAVSIGNDMGYGITGNDGTLYAWGDNTYGQSGKIASNAVALAVNDIKGVVSIAAGRQLSSAQKAFNTADTFDQGSQTKFSSDVVNKKTYITGALTSSGGLKVWGYYDPIEYGAESGDGKVVSPTDVKFGGGADNLNNYSRFIAVYPGYANNLFAVTALGQAVRITYDGTAYTQTIYDAFADKVGDKAKENWNVDSTNTVRFFVNPDTKVTKDSIPDLGDITLFIDFALTSSSAEPALGDVRVNGIYQNSQYKASAYDAERHSLVTHNTAGNVYRILNKDVDEGRFIKTTSTDGSRPKSFEPVFKFNGKEMSAEQISNMFCEEDRPGKGYEFVYGTDDSGVSNVGIKLDPVQSSKGGKVTVEFYIARYDCAKNYTVKDGAEDSDNAAYYDYKKCSIEIEIDNTASYIDFDAFSGNTVKDFIYKDGTSNIPVLDPNNEYNKYYSVAVQDVSTGVKKLSTFITRKLSDGGTAQKKIEGDILKDMKAKDKLGFPDKEKIDKGNLTYYLNDAADKYNDTYRFFVKDRDADVVKIKNLTSSGALAGVTQTYNSDTAYTISVALPDGVVDLSLYNGDTDEAKLAAYNAALVADFNNFYGMYDLGVKKEGDKFTLNFTYDTVLYTATDTTGFMVYEGTAVNSYAARAAIDGTKYSGNRFFESTLVTTEYAKYNASYTTDFTKPENDVENTRVAAVFSQPSVRFKVKEGDSEKIIYGKKDDGYNTHTVIWSGVVAGCAPIEIDLDDYVSVPGSYIFFAIDNSTSTEKYDAFSKSFTDETSGEQFVTLTSKKITIAPKSTAPINFTVDIQRFHGDTSDKISYSDADKFGDDEKVSISFRFTVNPFTFNWKGMDNSLSVSQTSTIDVLGGDSTLNKVELISLSDMARLKNEIKMSGLKTSNDKVLTVSKITDGEKRTSFEVTPVSSGTADVQFILTVLNVSKVCSLTFDVSGVTALGSSSKIELSETSYVNIGSIKNDLRRANSFRADINNFDILYDDPEAFYLTVEDVNGKRVEDLVQTYIKSLTFVDTDSSTPRLRLELDTDKSENLNVTYILHLRYVDTTKSFSTYKEAEETGAIILETVQEIQSAKQIVRDANGLYTVKADCDAPQEAESQASKDTGWFTTGSNLDMKVYVPIRKLLNLLNVENPDEYEIFLVSASSDAAQYINYTYNKDTGNVVITPLKNTPEIVEEDPETHEKKVLMDENGKPLRETVTINVSIAPSNPMSTRGNKIISFRMSVTGISETLPKETYVTIWLVAFFSAFGLLLIIFLIRMIVYWRRRAKQRALIKRNQELIRMRDRIHNKSTAATREQIVRSRMKMEDPKYAKMVNDIRKERQGDNGGITLESTGIGVSIPSEPGNKKKGKKKKNGKKSIAELKAELEAKKAAFAQAQAGTPVDVPVDGGSYAPGQDFGASQSDFGGGQPDFGSPTDGFAAQDLDVNSIIFDTPDNGNGQV